MWLSGRACPICDSDEMPRHVLRPTLVLAGILVTLVLPVRPALAAPTYARVLGLGDSVPTGATCACPNEVTLLGRRLTTAQGSSVAVTNAAHNGATSQYVLNQARGSGLGSPAGRVTTITVGANDFNASIVTTSACDEAACYQQALHDLAARSRAAISALLINQHGHLLTSSPIVVTGYWNVFLDGAVGRSRGPAYVRNSDALTRATNAVLHSAARFYGVTYADLYAPFKGDGSRDDTTLLGSDGDHPNAAGHRLIAATEQRALAGLV